MNPLRSHLGSFLEYILSAAAGIATVVLIGEAILLASAIYRTSSHCLGRAITNSLSEAIDISKTHLRLEGERRLEKYGIDASITEHSELLSQEPPPCEGPPRFHIGRKRELEGYSIVWASYAQKECPDCWVFYTVSVDVGKCGGAKIGGIGIRDFSYSSSARNGAVALCPPKYWPPRPSSLN